MPDQQVVALIYCLWWGRSWSVDRYGILWIGYCAITPALTIEATR